MFRKKCSRCGRKINKSYDFCPFCGLNLRSKYDDEDYGLLGKNDFMDESFMNFGDSFIDKIFNKAIKELPSMIKMIERRMQNSFGELDKSRDMNLKKIPHNLNIQFFVNGKRVFPQRQETEHETQTLKTNQISKEKAEKFVKLPKKEPLSKVRRFSGKIIYDISVPGVENIEDVLINRLENSIEIKALSKDKVYSKTLNLNLPILGCQLKDGNLILEFQAR